MPGKWGMHTFYSKHREISRLLPPTRILSRASLILFLNKYGSVYIKPNLEHTGKGIMKAWQTANGYRLVRIKGNEKRFAELGALADHILRKAAGKPHIVQKAIALAAIGGRPFDIRVMMMRDGTDRWRYSGMLAKVAGASSVVTNVRRGGGYATRVDEALSSSGSSVMRDAAERKKMVQRLINVSYTVCRYFDRYKRSSQIGIDYAVDASGRLWLIEVNFDFPSHALFALLKDKSAYRLIKRRRAEYLRSRAKNRR